MFKKIHFKRIGKKSVDYYPENGKSLGGVFWTGARLYFYQEGLKQITFVPEMECV